MHFDGTALHSNQAGPVYYADTWVIDCDEDVTSAEIKIGSKGIADNAFSGCFSLESIGIPASMKNIGCSYFSGCHSLEGIIIPDRVESIGDSAFQYSNLSGIIISDSVTHIEEDAFDETPLLSNQNGPVYYADTWVVDCDEDVTSVKIKDETKGIADYVFSGCYSLEIITIPDGVTSIGDHTFKNCVELTCINIPDFS